jgi:hypothetical protein
MVAAGHAVFGLWKSESPLLCSGFIQERLGVQFARAPWNGCRLNVSPRAAAHVGLNRIQALVQGRYQLAVSLSVIWFARKEQAGKSLGMLIVCGAFPWGPLAR